MFDATSPSEAASALERAEGSVRLSFRHRGAATALAHHYERGSFKARMPRPEQPGRPLAVLINTAGGLAGGDVLEAHIALEADAAATVTTQAAEKVYRSTGAAARVRVELTLAERARLDWLPQETILFDQARMERDIRVDMAADAEATLVEAIVLGRQAMGEAVRSAHLIDRWRLRRAGRLIYADALRVVEPIAPLAGGRASLGGARAIGTVLHASPLAAERLEPARAALADAGHACGASSWDGILLVRLLAPDGQALRRTLAAVLLVLCAGRKLPRPWSC